MTDQERRIRLIAWAKSYCQNDDVTEEELELFLEQAVPFSGGIVPGVQSYSLGDYSVSYLTNFPEHILSSLRPYKKIKFG